MSTRTERTGNMLIEQPVGQQWWDNPAPEAEVTYLPWFEKEWELIVLERKAA
jgi:hypothetical protein